MDISSKQSNQSEALEIGPHHLGKTMTTLLIIAIILISLILWLLMPLIGFLFTIIVYAIFFHAIMAFMIPLLPYIGAVCLAMLILAMIDEAKIPKESD